jgi:putative glutamine amidotransferase
MASDDRKNNSVGNSYIIAIENAGGTPILLPLIKNESHISDFLNIINGLLLSGGVDVDPLLYGEEPHPKMGKIDVDKDRVEMKLIPRALELDLPILGICRGIQVLNVAAGGTLYQDMSMSPNSVLKHRQEAPGSYATQTIEVKENSRLWEILGQSVIRVNSFHHQAVKEVAPEMITSAVSCDGIIEAIESPNHSFVIGIQFHPELMWETSKPVFNLFKAFVNAAEIYSRRE